MSKIIVFGSSGFIGKALVPLLSDVITPSSKEVDLANPVMIKTFEPGKRGDISVVMLAAITPDKGNICDSTVKNIVMARNVLEIIKGQDVKHFVYVSSDAVYPMNDAVIDESTVVSPDTLYGYMHAMREQYFREAFPDRLTIIRPCAIYGEGDSHNSYGPNRFIRENKQVGEITLFGRGEECRDHIHIEDVAEIIAQSIYERIFGTFNAVSGNSISFAEIASLIGDKINFLPRKSPITHRHFNNKVLFFKPKAIDVGIREMLGIV